ncbi:MAG: PQQ-dependent sugar dehydrogenase, partial [Nitrospira sp.]|nr:PQQ-dependent sugar dehydrogenase [Nitrospira sp.]
MKFLILLLTMIILSSGSGGCRGADDTPPGIRLELVAAGFTSPVALIAPEDGTERLFVVDQTGLIWIISGGQRLEEPFLDIRDRIVPLASVYDERGLLGLAFHPDFPANGRFYISYSAPLREGLSTEWDHTTYISEFTIGPDNPNRAAL